MEERFLKAYESGRITNLSVMIDKRLRPFMYMVFYDKLSSNHFVDINRCKSLYSKILNLWTEI